MPTETTFDRVEEQLKNKQLRYFNFYNSDVNAIVQRNTKYYEKHPHDVISLNQIINKMYVDIEVYTNNEGLDADAIDNGTYPINIVTIRNSTDLILHTYVLLFPNNMAQFGIVQGMTNDTYNQFIFDTEQWLVNELKSRTYIGTEFVEANYSVELHLYTDEKQLLLDLWNKIHEYDPDILTSWNGDNFDYYYMYNRCSTLFGEENVSKLMSKFNKVEVRNKRVVFFEYTVADLLYLYKPRSEGGLSYGSTQPFYALDFIAEVELEKKKVSYKEENLSLDDFYLKNPREATLYNIVDVVLIIGLDNKNKTIDLNNTIRRAMKTPFHSSIIGSSALYDAFVFSRLDFMGYKIRSNITTEGNLSFSKEWLQQFGTIKGTAKSKEIQACAISSKDFVKITKKFPGAYVKQPHPEIIDDDSMVIDLDASLPPWENILIKRGQKIYYGPIGYYVFEEGDLTLTWDINNEVCWKQVLGKTEHDWHGELIDITTETGRRACVTSNHSIFGVKHKTKVRQVSQIDAGSLNLNDYVYCYKKFDPESSASLQYPKTVGFWLSDGWSSNRKNFYIAKQDRNELDKHSPAIQNVRIKRQASVKYKEEYVGTCINGSELYPFTTDTKLKNFIEILNYKLEDRIEIWDGMLDADGHIKMNDDCLTPTQLLCKYRKPEADACFIVAHTIGWKPKQGPTGISNSVFKANDNRVTYGTEQVCPEVFKSVHGACSKLQQHNMAGNCRHSLHKIEKILPHVKEIYTNTMGLEKIKKIERQQYNGKVYDICVKDTERFFAGTGIGAHNTSMYPSNILQGNISFDCYVARILPPQCNSTLKLLFGCLGKGTFPSNLMANVQKMVTDYVVEKQISPKIENVQKFYYVTLGLFQKLANSQKTLDQICNPKSSEDSILLKTVLIPLLDIIFTIHPTSQSYNDFVYDFLYLVDTNDPNWQDNRALMKQKYPDGVWIIYNPNESDVSLKHITIDEAYSYIEQHCLALSGCIFTKHEHKTGLFVDMLNEFAAMRKHHKKLRDTYEEGSIDYKFENNNQNVFKRVMNTCYGLYGMSGFRYSDNWLARSITNNSLHALKIAMFKAEEYLTELYK